MKRMLAVLLLLGLLAAFTGVRAETTPAEGDATRCRVLLTGKADSYSVYQIVRYDEDTHILRSVTIITRFTPESGVTEEVIAGYDIGQAYPNTDKMDFVSHEVYTVDGCVNFAMRFDDLDVAANKKMMVDSGYLMMADPTATLTSDDYVNSLSGYGTVKEVPRVDYDRLGFHF